MYAAPIIPILVATVVSCTILSRDKPPSTTLRQKGPVPLKLPHHGDRLVTNLYQPLGIWDNKARGRLRNKRDNKRDNTVTILIFTAIFAVFNIPAAICYIIYTYDPVEVETLFQFDRNGFYFNNFIFNLAIPINALVNPLVYLVRMKLFRDSLRRYLRKMFKYLKVPIYL